MREDGGIQFRDLQPRIGSQHPDPQEHFRVMISSHLLRDREERWTREAISLLFPRLFPSPLHLSPFPFTITSQPPLLHTLHSKIRSPQSPPLLSLPLSLFVSSLLNHFLFLTVDTLLKDSRSPMENTSQWKYIGRSIILF